MSSSKSSAVNDIASILVKNIGEYLDIRKSDIGLALQRTNAV